LFKRGFRKENKKDTVTIVTGIRRRMKTEKILIIFNQMEVTRIFIESMILRRFFTERKRKKN
jgi:hypothetical protein